METPENQRHAPLASQKSNEDLSRENPHSARESLEEEKERTSKHGDRPRDRNADDEDHNMKFIVLDTPPEEKIAVELPPQRQPEKFTVELPPQQQAEKFLVVMPEEKIAVDGPAAAAAIPQLHRGAPLHELRGDAAEGEGYGKGKKRGDGGYEGGRASLSSAARDMGIGMAHFTGGTIKATAMIPRGLEKGFQLGIPTNYGRDAAVRADPNITGWKSGMTAAGTGMYYGFYDGVTGLFLQPYEGAKEEGAKGFFKGCGKGMTGLVLKSSAGTFGAPGHALMGAYRELKKGADRLQASNNKKRGQSKPGEGEEGRHSKSAE